MTPCSIWIPPSASGPVLTVSSPSLNGAARATAGAGKRINAAAAPAAVPANRTRRLILEDVNLLDIAVLPLSPLDCFLTGRSVAARPPRFFWRAVTRAPRDTLGKH